MRTVFPREETLPELLYNRLSDSEREDGTVSSGSPERSFMKGIWPHAVADRACAKRNRSDSRRSFRRTETSHRIFHGQDHLA
jgi:hypothetical protein